MASHCVGWILHQLLLIRFSWRTQSKVDKSSLESYVLANPDIKLSEVVADTESQLLKQGRILRKLGFSYKKKPLPIWKLMKKKEINT